MTPDELERKAAMQHAVAALPEPQRSVFQLCAADGLAYPAVAERLGISIAEVERLLAAALLGIDRSLRNAGCAPDPVGFGGKARPARLHRLARWLGSR